MLKKNKLQLFLERQQRGFVKGGIPSLSQRQNRLNRVSALLLDNQQGLCNAIAGDSPDRLQVQLLWLDIYAPLKSLSYTTQNLKDWMKAEGRDSALPVLKSRAELHYQPKGVVGVIADEAASLASTMSALAGVLAAGNRCMVKLSSNTPKASSLLEKLIGEYFNEEELVAVVGDDEITNDFSQLGFNHLVLMTNSTDTAKKIANIAGNHLIPLTLELGGKAPVIVGEKANLKKSARWLVLAKLLNAGQSSFSPDTVWIKELYLNEFIAECEKAYEYYFSSAQVSKPSKVLKEYLEQVKVLEGEVWEISVNKQTGSSDNHELALNLVINPSEEIEQIGSGIHRLLLTVKTYPHIDELIETMNHQPKPAMLYYYGGVKKEQDFVLKHSISGSVTLNGLIQKTDCMALPFNRIAESGEGSCHGIEGFKTFSHVKSVYAPGWFKSGVVRPIKGKAYPSQSEVTQLIKAL